MLQQSQEAALKSISELIVFQCLHLVDIIEHMAHGYLKRPDRIVQKREPLQLDSVCADLVS